MDFDADWQNARGKKDHSPAADINAAFLASETGAGPIGAKVSNSTDDFEHITNEKIDFDIDSLGSKAASVISSIAKETPLPLSFVVDDDSDSENEVLSKPTKAPEPALPISAAAAFDAISDPWDQPGSFQSPIEPVLLPTLPKAISPEPIRPVSITPEREVSLPSPIAPKPAEPELLIPTKVAEVAPVPATIPAVAPPKAPEPIVQRTITPEPIVTPPKTPEPISIAPIVEPKTVAPPPPRAVEPEVKPVPKPAFVAVPEPAQAAVAPKPSSFVSSTGKKEQMIAVEEIFYKLGLDAWFKPERLHPQVEALIYWRDPKKSGIVFAAGLLILLAVSSFSVISVVAYSSLLALLGTVSFRIYKNILQAVQKTSEGHPFKEYLDVELVLPQERVQQVAAVSVAHINAFLAELRRLFLVEDLIDSIKFGFLLWGLTYLGSWFNGMTLVILGYVALFTLPKVYENNKQSIDAYLDLVRSKILEITDKVKAAVPLGKKAVESDKEK